jgi:hypothetical protein
LPFRTILFLHSIILTAFLCSPKVFYDAVLPHLVQRGLLPGFEPKDEATDPDTFAVHSSPKALLEKFEGCEDFKSKMQQLELLAAELRELGRPVDDLLSNWLFVGEPRTGMVAPPASLIVLAAVTWPSYLLACFLLYLASILALSLPVLKYDVQRTPVFVF